MRYLIIATLAAAVAVLPSAAKADPHDGWERLEEKRRECARDLHRAEHRRDYYKKREECRREIAKARRQLHREAYRDRDHGDWDRDERYHDDWDRGDWRRDGDRGWDN